MSDILPRERLFHILDHCLERPVTWIHGPGGSGKSTLVASYLDFRKLPSIWYQVDQGDADVATLFHYMRLAARKAAPQRGRPLPLFTPEYQPGAETFARRYFEKLFARLKPPYTLVLDDYHEVGPDSIFHEVVKYAFAEVPQGINIIVMSRTPPPPAMARLRAGKQMSFVGWDELRLTVEETTGIIQLHGRSGEWPEAFGKLHDRIGGWVAGLVLLLERGSVEELEQWLEGKRTQQEIFNYFAEELFNKTDPRIRDLLLKTSFMPAVLPRLAERLSENSDAAVILAELHNHSFFTEKRYDGEVIYRFHPLFREYLINKAETVYDRQHLAQIKASASDLLEESGRIEEAASLCIDTSDWSRLAGLIVRNAPTFLCQGRNRTVIEWVDRLPLPLLQGTPYLLFWSGASLFSSDPVESRSRFKKAFEIFRSQGDETGVFLSWCGVVDATIHTSEYALMPQWIEVLSEVLKEHPRYSSRDIEVRVALNQFNAVAFGLPNHRDINTIREQAFALLCTGEVSDANLFLSAGLHLAIHLIYQGDLARAAVIVDLIREPTKSKGANEFVLMMVKTVEAHYAFATCELEKCLEKAFEVLDLSVKSGIDIWAMHNHGHALAAALAKGDENIAGELTAKMSAGLTDCRRVDKAYYYWLMAWKFALQENFVQTRQFLELALEIGSRIGFVAPETAMMINMAETHLDLGNQREASLCLQKALPRVLSMDSAYLSLIYFLTESYLHMKEGNEPKEIDSLKKAFRLGALHRIENFYFWKPERMTRLCMKALEAGIEVEYVTALIRKRELWPTESPIHIERWPWPLKVYMLGSFRLVKDGKTLAFSGKVQKKPLEILKALIALGGEEKTEGQIADLLWPDSNGDTARNSFKVTLYRLRELVGAEKALQLREGRLFMDRRYFWVDAWAFESLLAQAQMQGEAGEETKAIGLTKNAISLYRGHFVAEDADKPWAVSLRKRLKSRFVLNVVALAGLYRKRNDDSRAMSCYLYGLEVDDLAEEIYQNLMECYLSAGLRAEAIKAFERCKKNLAIGLRVPPSPKTTALYEAALK